MERKRNSSIELLRIICMIFIIAHHYVVHGGFDTFTIETLSSNAIILQMLSIWGKMACNIFILITGYFLVKSKVNVKKNIILILEMLFYSLGIVLIFKLFGLGSVGLKDILKSFLCMFYGNWFLIDYLILCCFIPFLNKIINNFNKKELFRLCVVLLVICSIIPTFAINSKFDFTGIDIMIIMYFIGAYIRLYVDNKSRRIYSILMISFATLLILSVLFFDISGMLFNKNTLIKNATYFSKVNSILVIACAIFTFLHFSMNNNFYSKAINMLSSSTLGIYLLHDNDLIRKLLWENIFPNVQFLNSNYFILHVIVKIFSIFIICLIIDKIRMFIFDKTVNKIIDKYFDKLYDKIKSVIKVFEEKVKIE